MNLNRYQKARWFSALTNDAKAEINKIVGFIHSSYYDLNDDVYRNDKKRIKEWNKNSPFLYDALKRVLVDDIRQLEPHNSDGIEAKTVIQLISLLKKLVKKEAKKKKKDPKLAKSEIQKHWKEIVKLFFLHFDMNNKELTIVLDKRSLPLLRINNKCISHQKNPQGHSSNEYGLG